MAESKKDDAPRRGFRKKTLDADGGKDADKRLRQALADNEMDRKFGFDRYEDSAPRDAWLVNMHATELLDPEKRLVSAVDYYFIEEDGSRFKVTMPFMPYFYVAARAGCEREVLGYLTKKYYSSVSSVEFVQKEDLDLPNHLVGLKRTYIKLSFVNSNDLTKVKRELMPQIRRNKESDEAKSDYTEMLTHHFTGSGGVQFQRQLANQLENVVDIREHDVPLHVRAAVDSRVFVGHWYSVVGRGVDRQPHVHANERLVDWPEPVVLAFDIETTKLPLRFPDAALDQVMMISYMVDGVGFLIVNREIVGADVDDFEYTPRAEFAGPFSVANEPDERATLVRFFEHIQHVRPHIIVTYNGDSFDWPFVETRAQLHGLNMATELGFAKDTQDEYKARHCIHMDAYRWVKRDSYLPVGSQNLKATAKAKLHYDPIELDPEEMCRMAREQPQVLASYSVSDAVATYYLYMKYVHPFIFALCTIVPMQPDEVLRKGSGTLCEALLMVEAFRANVVFPNKQEAAARQTTADGRLVDSETYVGGHVEALETGIYRADVPCRFRLVPAALQQLIERVRPTLRHTLEVEEGVPLDLVDNFDEVCEEISRSLAEIRDQPARLEKPIIYHLDVAAMYPNIILTNRLQPPAVVTEETCAACDFNKDGAKCQRKMNWMWRGDIIPANRSEYQRILQQLENEKFPPVRAGERPRAFHELSKDERAVIEKKRLQDYCRMAYKRVHEKRLELRETVVCQRENSFYVDTVRAFRDRRYDYKRLLKTTKKKLAGAQSDGDANEIKSLKAKEVLYDSLQLAHKCILNSFYGYVMRRGSRWFSMEMAGIVCHTGANIIKQARELIEQIGRPLELDTDGIWCILPASFPENVTLRTRHESRPAVTVSYPGAMLNALVKESFTNDQYHTLVDAAALKYEVRSENSIFFEVDGPYLAMILPAAKEEGKKLKKRYAVFNVDGSLAELKGFEVKRRGELQLIKVFQSSVFESFLSGASLVDAYAAVAKVADYWLDVLYSRAVDLPDAELFHLVAESRNMSRKLEDYGAQKSTSITTAHRLAEFLGDQMVKEAGLACRYIIAKKPEGSPVTERAIPLAIFQAEPSIRRHHLKRWLKAPALDCMDIRGLLDWEYYVERLGSAIQKIITIPAALQGIANPVPRVSHPDWLHKRLVAKDDMSRQRRITDMFSAVPKRPAADADIEDLQSRSAKRPRTVGGADAEPLVDTVAATPRAPAVAQTYRGWRDVLGAPPPAGVRRDSRLQWLQFQKRKWALQHGQRRVAARDRRQRAFDADRPMPSGTAARHNPRLAMSTYMRASASALVEMVWQIIQVVETSEPGLFHVWALVGEELHRVSLRVPRIFYVNLREPKESEVGPTYRKVQKHLPRSNPVLNLYEYSVPEAQFRKLIKDLKSELRTSNVEGIYETQMPLMFRVLTSLGCLCQVSAEQRCRMRGRETDAFNLDQLEFRDLTHSEYLSDSSLKHLYLYQYRQDTRSMWGLFIPASRKAHVWLVDRGKTENIPNLSKLYNDELRNRRQNDPSGTFPKEDFSFEVAAETNIRVVYRGLQRVLRAYRDEKRGATFVAYQATSSADSLTSNIPQLTEFPLVKLHISDSESLYSALQWQDIGCRRMIQHFQSSMLYLHSYGELCRYLHIPLGNVPKDAPMLGADLLFARHLARQNHVTWCSTAERPDFGGRELDDNRLIVDPATTASGRGENARALLEAPGLYDAVCAELDVSGAAVSALLQSQRIAECEGGAAAIGFDAAGTLAVDEMLSADGRALLAGFDDVARCAPAFKILKHLVHEWVREIAHNKNVFADEQIVHFYRWLRTPSSLLYEPALARALQAQMKKLSLLLLAELRRLGAVVVHATYNHVVICTKKHSVQAAHSYVDFILKSARRKELFAGLDISLERGWQLLTWIDSVNYGGFPADWKKSDEENSVVDAETSMMDMHWNMAHFLPTAAFCRQNFHTVLAGYLLVVFRQLIAVVQDASEQGAAAAAAAVADGVQDGSGGVSARLGAYRRALISGELSQRLFAIVDKLNQKISVDASTLANESLSGASDLFPVLPGSHLRLRSPALEFAKFVCQVLSVDEAVAEEVGELKCKLLQIVGVDEFATDATWRDPCLSYVLPEVICAFCNHCRDLDLCREMHFDDAGKVAAWRCVHCRRAYDTSRIEFQLVDQLNHLSMAFNLQDLLCNKCNQVKEAHLRSYCECAGEYTLTLTHSQLLARLRCFQNIANFYNLHLLMDSTEMLLAANSHQS